MFNPNIATMAEPNNGYNLLSLLQFLGYMMNIYSYPSHPHASYNYAHPHPILLPVCYTHQ